MQRLQGITKDTGEPDRKFVVPIKSFVMGIHNSKMVTTSDVIKITSWELARMASQTTFYCEFQGVSRETYPDSYRWAYRNEELNYVTYNTGGIVRCDNL